MTVFKYLEYEMQMVVSFIRTGALSCNKCRARAEPESVLWVHLIMETDATGC